MLKIDVQTIPVKEHRYPTVGDWFYTDDGTLRVRVAESDDPRIEMLIAIHELFEAFAAWANPITEPEVTKFDLWFEEQMNKGLLPSYLDEPGMHPNCPYHEEHVLATAVEMMLATKLGMNWADYEKNLIELSNEYYNKGE